MSPFAVYSIGFVILIIGLGYVAYLLEVPTQWVIAGGIVLLGLGTIRGASKLRRNRDESEE